MLSIVALHITNTQQILDPAPVAITIINGVIFVQDKD